MAWFHCFSGIAGDMALGALVDAGADVDEVRGMVARVAAGGWTLDAEETQRGGIGATRAVVTTTEDHHHRTFTVIRSLLASAGLPARVHDRAVAVFGRLAEAEGRIHRTPPDDVHFHEVGGLDAIVDVVGVCAALEVLGIDRVRSSPVALGLGAGSAGGLVAGAHGPMPNPVPAATALLAGAPVYGLEVPVELTTPTGAALLTALAEGYGPLPAMTIADVGYGAGTRELEHRPNLVQVVIGTAEANVGFEPPGQPVVLLEANVDDATGETLAYAIGALLAAGANDAWITPIVMKKGRPAHTVHALADPALAAQVAAVLSAETGSLGLRGQTLERWPAARHVFTVDVDGQPVRVKVGPGRAKAEHDVAARAAEALRRPLRDVAAQAESAWRASNPHEP